MTNCILVTLAVVAAGLWADEVDGGEQFTIPVCLESANSFTLIQASTVVSGMYAAIGVEIDWRRPRNCPSGAVRITMQYFTYPTEKPHALAYAMRYPGTRIVVFHDRVEQAVEPRKVPALMAHVMAHEIGHILEGAGGHSTSGVMKARFDGGDISEMAFRPIPFAPEDVFRIRFALRNRAVALLARRR